MKLKNLTDLADLLRGLDNHSRHRKMGFDMQYTYDVRHISPHPCGSACCIGGWVQYRNKDTRDMELEHAVRSISPEGIPLSEIYKLCYPTVAKSPAWSATPQQAARAVEILRDTGKCDWDEAMK